MERNLHITAVILASRRMGDLHRTVTLLSPEAGLIQAAAYGARKGKSRLSGWVEPFASGDFNIYHNPVRQLYKIEDVGRVRFREAIRQDLYAQYLASFWAELIISTYGGGGEHYRLFGLLEEALDQLELLVDSLSRAGQGGGTGGGHSGSTDRGIPPDLLVQTVWRFLDIIGYFPDIGSCGACGKTLEGEPEIQYDSGTGDFLCRNCRKTRTLDEARGNLSEMMLHQGALRYLNATLRLSLREALAVKLSPAAMAGLRRLSLLLVSRAVDQPLNTLQARIL